MPNPEDTSETRASKEGKGEETSDRSEETSDKASRPETQAAPEEKMPLREAAYDPSIPYLTLPEAAKILGIQEQSVRNACVHGRIRCVHLFGRVLIAPADVEAYRLRVEAQPRGRPRGKLPKEQ